MEFAGKALIVAGVAIVLAGGALLMASRFPGAFGWIGNLPGDIHVKKESFSFFFPLGASILISAMASLLLRIVSRFF